MLRPDAGVIVVNQQRRSSRLDFYFFLHLNVLQWVLLCLDRIVDDVSFAAVSRNHDISKKSLTTMFPLYSFLLHLHIVYILFSAALAHTFLKLISRWRGRRTIYHDLAKHNKMVKEEKKLCQTFVFIHESTLKLFLNATISLNGYRT